MLVASLRQTLARAAGLLAEREAERQHSNVLILVQRSAESREQFEHRVQRETTRRQPSLAVAVTFRAPEPAALLAPPPPRMLPAPDAVPPAAASPEPTPAPSPPEPELLPAPRRPGPSVFEVARRQGARISHVEMPDGCDWHRTTRSGPSDPLNEAMRRFAEIFGG